MKNFFRCVRLGMGWLPGFGNHPGTKILTVFVLAGLLAGAQRGGLLGAIVGAAVMLVGIGWIYVLGAYDRGKDYTAIRSRQDYERQLANASIADRRRVAQYLRSLHDSSEPCDQPWMLRAAELLEGGEK